MSGRAREKREYNDGAGGQGREDRARERGKVHGVRERKEKGKRRGHSLVGLSSPPRRNDSWTAVSRTPTA